MWVIALVAVLVDGELPALQRAHLPKATDRVDVHIVVAAQIVGKGSKTKGPKLRWPWQWGDILGVANL